MIVCEVASVVEIFSRNQFGGEFDSFSLSDSLPLSVALPPGGDGIPAKGLDKPGGGFISVRVPTITAFLSRLASSSW